MKESIIQIKETFYNLDNIIQFKVLADYIDLLYPGNIHIRVEDEDNIEKIKRYFRV